MAPPCGIFQLVHVFMDPLKGSHPFRQMDTFINEQMGRCASTPVAFQGTAVVTSLGSSGNGVGHSRTGKGVSADFAGGACTDMTLLAVASCSPPRLGLDGKPELTEAPRLRATAAEGIPEGFRQAKPGRVAPGGAEARSPSPARNDSGRYRNPLEILKRYPLTRHGSAMTRPIYGRCYLGALPGPLRSRVGSG